MIRSILCSLLFVHFSISVLAQDQKCPCCTEQHSQFNFWIGDWDVLDDGGNIIGSNSIQVLQDSCILQENWISASGSTGSSYNYYNNVDSTWNQVWVDNSGGVLNLKGKFEYGEMTLKTTDLFSPTYSRSYMDKITWTPLEDGTVRQYWERSTNGGDAWIVVFNGLYVRKK